jgi:hypothetical protein
MLPADEPPLSFSKRAHRRRRSRAAVFALCAAALASPRPSFGQDAPDTASWFSFSSPKGKKPEAGAFVGDGECSKCHRDKVTSYHRTAHFMTSSLPSEDTIHGSFKPGSDTLVTVNPNLYFLMEVNAKGYFQTANMRTSPTVVMTRSERIDVVVGSGRKGQSYLFWDGDLLFQLPVSYWTELDGWVNSPGYVDGNADFERPIGPRCLECHAGRFENQPPPINRYATSGMVLGITCERCHGPGGRHVALFGANATRQTQAESAIVNPATLSRARQLDICGQCHEGPGTSVTPPLSFAPGESLDQYLVFAKLDPGARVDVHASQVQLLKRSRCFRSSSTMTCATCHDVHTPQRDLAAFSSLCLKCHKVESCRALPRLGHAIDGRCVECHMPLQQTVQIISRVNGASVRPKVRNHQIAIYSESTPP